MASALSPETLRVALARIAAWRLEPDAPVACPICERPGLAVIDRSARPYSEWYVLGCADCGLDETVHVPLRPPVMGGLD